MKMRAPALLLAGIASLVSTTSAACNPAQFSNPSFEAGVKEPWTTPKRNILDKFPAAGEVVATNPSFPAINPADGTHWLQGQSGLTFAQTIEICPGTNFLDMKLRVKSDKNCEIWNNGYAVTQGGPTAGGWGWYIDAKPDGEWQVLDYTLAFGSFSGNYSIQFDVGDCYSWEGWTFVDNAEIVRYR